MANLTEDIPGFWGTLDPALASEIFPLAQEDMSPLAAPPGSNYTLVGNSLSPNFHNPFFPSTQVVGEFVSPQEIEILYCDVILTSVKVKRIN